MWLPFSLCHKRRRTLSRINMIQVYSFAIILWQMAAHAVPFAGMAAGGLDNFIKHVAQQGARPPLPPKWPAALRATLVTCWEAEALRRATISAALPALEELLVQLELGTRPKSAGRAAGREPSLSQGSSTDSAPSSSDRPVNGPRCTVSRLAALFSRRASVQ